jgi:hypothetical protein
MVVMRIRTTLAMSLVVALSASLALAGEVKSGPQAGEKVGAFEVVKAAGNPTDEVAEGAKLCYRCKLGARPVVMVFSRKPDQNLTKLVKELDQVVAKNSEKKMASFVNLLGANSEDLTKAAKDFIANAKVENIAVVVPQDQPNGPADYKIDPQADVTVLIYKDGTVAVNHAYAAGGLNDAEIKKIVGETSKILN